MKPWCLLALCLIGCGGTPDPDSRRRTLEATATRVALPAHRDFAARAGELDAAVLALGGTPDDDHLAAARSGWKAARLAWRALAALNFGPAVTQGTLAAVDFWPTRPADIERAVADAPAPLDASYVARLGAAQRGLPALEYLLFGPTSPVGSSPDAAVRRTLAGLLAHDIATRAGDLRAAWEPEEGGYAGSLAHAGESGSVVPSTRAGVDLLLNASVAALVDLTDATLARPLGEKSGGTPQPDLVEAPYAPLSIESWNAALDGLTALYVGERSGERGEGLTLLVGERSPELDRRVRASLTECRARSAALGEPLASVVEGDPAPAAALLAAARTLRRSIGTEVVQTVGGQLVFGDNDGD